MRDRLRHLTLALSSAFFVHIPGHAGAASGASDSAEARPVANLRARLTEREDEISVARPFTIDFLGYPLSATLQYELAFDWIRQITRDPPWGGKSRVLFEQEAKPELFYTLGPQLSLFAQARVGMEKDLLSATRQRGSRSFVERGEMWLYSETIPGSARLKLEIGRLDFEDDRRWWWDEDLDALRITVAGESFELALAVARELYPTRSDRRFVAPENEAVQRVIAEVSWDWRADHSIQLFALFHDDRSRTPGIGEFITRDIGEQHVSHSPDIRFRRKRPRLCLIEFPGLRGHWGRQTTPKLAGVMHFPGPHRRRHLQCHAPRSASGKSEDCPTLQSVRGCNTRCA